MRVIPKIGFLFGYISLNFEEMETVWQKVDEWLGLIGLKPERAEDREQYGVVEVIVAFARLADLL